MTCQVVVLTMKDCDVCAQLEYTIRNLQRSPVEHAMQVIFLGDWVNQSAQLQSIRPRVFPTVIAFKNGIPRLGWEGFAVMAPEEIQEAAVLDVLRQAAALADEDEETERAALAAMGRSLLGENREVAP